MQLRHHRFTVLLALTACAMSSGLAAAAPKSTLVLPVLNPGQGEAAVYILRTQHFIAKLRAVTFKLGKDKLAAVPNAHCAAVLAPAGQHTLAYSLGKDVDFGREHSEVSWEAGKSYYYVFDFEDNKASPFMTKPILKEVPATEAGTTFAGCAYAPDAGKR